MEANKTILQMKYARVVELFARLSGLDGEELVACLCTAHQGQAGVVHGG